MRQLRLAHFLFCGVKLCSITEGEKEKNIPQNIKLKGIIKMKKIIALSLVIVLCFAFAACGNKNEFGNNNTTESTTAAPQVPTVADVVNGIKYEFKDPDSVQMSDVGIARVKNNGIESTTEFYIIGTVRAKNGFGGYADPQAYVIHCNNGSYRIVEEFNDASYMKQRYFTDHGCGPHWIIY